MNKQIIVAVLMIGLVSLAAGVGTYAYFSDTESSINNTFTASTLDLTVDSKNDPDVRNFTFSSLAPCRSGTMSWTLRNIGKTPGFIDISANVTNAPGNTTEPERIYNPDLGELGANMNVTLELLGAYGNVVVYRGRLNGMATSHNINYPLNAFDPHLVPRRDTAFLTLNWYIPKTVGNEIQGDVAIVNLTIHLNQTA